MAGRPTVERLTLDQKVAGSSPAPPAIYLTQQNRVNVVELHLVNRRVNAEEVPMRKNPNPPRRCEQCGQMFVPLHRRRPARMCGIPCRAAEQSARLRGKPQPVNAERRRRAGLAIRTAHLAADFGGLTRREQHIYDMAHRHGYSTGYGVGYRSMPSAMPDRETA